MLNSILGPKGDDGTEKWRELQNEELNKLYSFTKYFSGDEKHEVGWACSTYGENRGVYWVLVWKPEGKRPLGRPTPRCENNIKVDLNEAGWGELIGMIWLGIRTGGGNF